MPYGNQGTSTANDREKFAAYTRDGYTGLDYADQRYYASMYGRFNTVDRVGADPTNPASWNKYSYVLGDPVNSWDPKGLCTVVSGGITQSAAAVPSDASGAEGFANEVGAISVFPFSNGSIPGGLLNLLAQGAGLPAGGTATLFTAIALEAQNPGPISLDLFSGSAGLFANLWGSLSPALQARIQNITYIDPAGFTPGAPLPSGVAGTNVSLYTDFSDGVNAALQAFGAQPAGNVNFVNTAPCGHNSNCVYNTFSAQLSNTATSCSIGGGAVLGLPQRGVIAVSGIFSGTFWYLPDPPPVEFVTEEITYSLP